MKIKFTNHENVLQEWDFQPGKVMDDAAEQVEAVFKGTWEEFRVAVMKGGTRARRVLLWHLQRLTHPSLQFTDLPRFEMGQLVVEYDRDELLEYRQRLESSAIPAADKEMALAAIDSELARLPAAEDGGKGKGGRSRTVGTTTRSTSPTT